jgi:ankyrin repeat protein
MNKVYNISQLAKDGNIAQIREVFDNNPLHPIEERDSNDMTPYLHAAKNGHVHTMTLLKELGANINAFDNYGNTALALAVANDNNTAVYYCLNQGSDPDVTYNYEHILHVAIHSKNMLIVEELIRYGADPTNVNKSGYDCRQLAIRFFNTQDVKYFNDLLIKYGWL